MLSRDDSQVSIHLMPDNPSNREFTARDIVPILALIAFVVVNLFGKWPRLSWILVVVAVFFGILDHYSALQERFLKWKARRDDRRTVKKAFPAFRDLVRRFGPFIDNRMNDTLHHIVHNELYPQLPNSRLIQFPNIDLWSSHWLYFSQKLDRLPLTMAEFQPVLMEFHFLVASYCSYCVAPFFENPPHGFHSEIPPGTKSKLNLFQQRLARFLGEYQDFSKHLSESRPSLHGLPIYCLVPSPIS